jgi:hypothetical protein
MIDDVLDTCGLRKEETFYAIAEAEITSALRERYVTKGEIGQLVLQAAKQVFGSSDGIEVTVDFGYFAADHVYVNYHVNADGDCAFGNAVKRERFLHNLLRPVQETVS